jgi:hypothetical protein
MSDVGREGSVHAAVPGTRPRGAARARAGSPEDRALASAKQPFAVHEDADGHVVVTCQFDYDLRDTALGRTPEAVGDTFAWQEAAMVRGLAEVFEDQGVGADVQAAATAQLAAWLRNQYRLYKDRPITTRVLGPWTDRGPLRLVFTPHEFISATPAVTATPLATAARAVMNTAQDVRWRDLARSAAIATAGVAGAHAGRALGLFGGVKGASRRGSRPATTHGILGRDARGRFRRGAFSRGALSRGHKTRGRGH